MHPLVSALPLYLSKEVRALLKVAVPLLLVGLVAASPAAAKSGTASRDGARAHAAGGGAVALTYPSIVNRRLVRGEKALDRATDYVDREKPDKAITSLLNARRNMYAAWRGAKYVIDHAPPPAPVESGSLRAQSHGSVHKSGGAVGPTLASPPETAFAVLNLQHDVATTAFGLIDGAKGTLLGAVNSTIFAALNRRDQAIAYIHKVAPPAPPVESGSLRSQRQGAVHKSGGAVAATFDTVMPGLIPLLDDELQEIEAQQDGGAVVPTGKKILNDAELQVTRTERTVNQFWPPLPADG